MSDRFLSRDELVDAGLAKAITMPLAGATMPQEATTAPVTAQSLKTRMDQDQERTAARLFIALCRESGLPAPAPQYLFMPGERKFRLDFAWPEYRLGLEVQGGLGSVVGAHSSKKGAHRDMEKHNAAVLRGWSILYASPKQLCTAETIELVKDYKRNEGLTDEW